MTPEVEALAQRLEEVEKQLAHLAALVTEHSDTDRTVAARSFVVKDEKGNRRAELGMMVPADQTEARPCLALFDSTDARALLTLPEAGPMLLLSHAKSKAAIYAGIDDHGPGVHVVDANGKRLLNVAVSSEGEPQVTLFGPDGKRRLVLAVSPSGEPVFSIFDGNGVARLAQGLSVRGEPVLRMSDANAKPVLDLKAEASGAPSLVMSDRTGESVVHITTSETGGGMRLSNPAEKFNFNIMASPSGTYLRIGDTNGPSLKLAVDKDGPCLVFGKDNEVFWSAP